MCMRRNAVFALAAALDLCDLDHFDRLKYYCSMCRVRFDEKDARIVNELVLGKIRVAIRVCSRLRWSRREARLGFLAALSLLR